MKPEHAKPGRKPPLPPAAPLSDAEKLGKLREFHQIHLDHARKNLIGKFETIAEIAKNALLRLKSDQEYPLISSCGELQGLGPSSDVACSEFARAQQAMKEHDAVVAGKDPFSF